MPSGSLPKVRLDSLLLSKGFTQSREKAKALILSGKVIVNGSMVDKAGTYVSPDVSIELLRPFPYVSRGGLKLEAAIQHFHIDVRGKVAMDVGASTGGFTDCLLQHGADRVYAVDVGFGQLDWRIRNDPKVVVLEKRNIRYLQKDLIPLKIDIAVVDVSFISLQKVIPKVIGFVSGGGEIIALIKPQFEVSRKEVGKGGVVRDEVKRNSVVEKIKREMESMSLDIQGVMQSPITGPKGNIEFFIYSINLIDRVSE
jgi:23S rRNA (cytidine1920-2'-O)/16S rRNA (cytidine1409-2'-O)-methyltransferase